jgi:hypothetical protein
MALIKCPECSSDISDQAPACPTCGFMLKNDSPGLTSKEISKQAGTANNKRNKIVGIFNIVGIIVFIFLLLLLIKGLGIIKISIVDTSITVSARNYSTYAFNAKGIPFVKVGGNFEASGGSGNDIRVLVMTKRDFLNWENNIHANFLYDSGQQTSTKLDVSLDSGEKEYVIVFDNTFSLLSDKVVTANIFLK